MAGVRPAGAASATRGLSAADLTVLRIAFGGTLGFAIALALHWDVMEERAAHYGVTVDRNAWRLVGLMHLAETREQAYAEVEHGILDSRPDLAAAFELGLAQ